MESVDDLTRAVEKYRDKSFADWLVVAITLAAETQPDMIRRAFEKVFDMKATVDQIQHADHLAREARAEAGRTAAEVRALCDQVHKDIDRVEKRLDAICAEFDNRFKETA